MRRDSRPSFLTVPEVAERLRASVFTVRRRIKAGELSATRSGRRLLVLESDLAAYIARLPKA
nr:helix-turn-helix domain-containing protein [Georgenia yuyongxinii]